MGWLTAIGTIAKVVGAVKSKPSKSKMEAFSPLQGLSLNIGRQQIKAMEPYHAMLQGMIDDVVHKEGSVKSYLAGLSRADAAQANQELSYEKVKNVRAAVAGAEGEAELANDITLRAEELDNNMLVSMYAAQKKQVSPLTSNIYSLGQAQGALDKTKLANKAYSWSALGNFAGELAYGIDELRLGSKPSYSSNSSNTGPSTSGGRGADS